MGTQQWRGFYLGLLASLVIVTSPNWCRACPADLTGNSEVDVDDLLVLINAWGDSGPADLTLNGVVDVDDLLTLINAWGPCPIQDVTTTIVGAVQLSDGTPVQNAVIVSDLGGEGVSSGKGTFQFDVTIPAETTSLNLTAVAVVNNFNYVGSAVANSIVPGGITDAGVIVLSGGTPTCDELSWLPAFGGNGFNNIVYALTVFDDGLGGGPALYAGGGFTSAGGVIANYIAKWDGSSWSSVGGGVSLDVRALTVFDDGSGGRPALYAAGHFMFAGGVSAAHIAKWDGSTWSPLGSGTIGPFGGIYGEIMALTVFDDGSGSGPALYAGGGFELAGGIVANNIARWDGSSWSPLDIGLGPAYVYALAVFDDGSGDGPALYAGGSFYTSGSEDVYGIAKWNPGSGSWSPLGSGVGGYVHALAVFDDGAGGGPALYAGGQFTTAGGAAASNIARWDGKSWSPLGLGVTGIDPYVYALNVFDDGSGAGPELHVGGAFSSAGGVAANNIAKWNGSSWSTLGSGLSYEVYAITGFDDGSGRVPALYAGSIAKWSSSSWSALEADFGVNGDVLAITVFDDGYGRGPALYAGGYFTTAGGITVNRIAKWNGTSWSPLGDGVSGGMFSSVHALAVFDDGSGGGPALYAGGFFTNAGGLSVNYIAKWNGSSWSALGSGMDNPVETLTVFDDGSGGGTALYAGGHFTTAGGSSANRVARWNGSSWSALGSGMNKVVYALTAINDGSDGGPALYAGGYLTVAGGIAANRIAKWNGSSWSALGSGVGSGIADFVSSLTFYDDNSGGGPALYAAGNFNLAGGVSAKNIAKWNGSSWSPLGSGTNAQVYALAVFDDGSGDGPALYAGGFFTAAGGMSAKRIARWDGLSFSALGDGMKSQVNGLTVFDDGSGGGPALCVGGSFDASHGGDSFLAKWGCPGAK